MLKLSLNYIMTAAVMAMMTPAVLNSASLKGTVMGSNVKEATKSFDGDITTSFCGAYASNNNYVRNWVGLDLGEPHVITSVGIAPDSSNPDACRFAVVQGANQPDFSDAIPIMVFKSPLMKYNSNTQEVTTSRGFRYVRVVATNSQGYFAEVEFEGYPGTGDDSQFYQMTNLPLVSFVTPGMKQIMSKDDKHPDSYVTIVSEDGTRLLEDRSAQMKGRGNGSWTFPKKPFQIKFDKKQKPLDATAKAKKWTLINNYGDRTLMRNKIAFEISRLAGMDYTPYCTFVDVIYNGEYEGCYQLCDQVEAKEGRVEIMEMTPDDIEGEELTGGYFIEIDAYANQEISWFKSNRGTPVTIKSPDDDEIVRAQSEYITNHFNKLEQALYSSDFMNEETGYRRYLDLESFLRYFIVCELDGNQDSFWSVYMRKDRGDDQFHVGPVWDVDLGFQNCGSPYPVNNMNDFLYTHRDASKAGGMEQFVNRIVKEDNSARDLLSHIWSDLRYNGNLNYEYIESLIDGWVEEIDEAQTLNFVRWPILNQSVQKQQKIYGTYEGEIQNVKSYLSERFPKLDNWLNLHYVESSVDEALSDSITNATETIYYDLYGRRVKSDNLTPGLYIRKRGFSTDKVLIK